LKITNKKVIELARVYGFDLAGFARVEPLDEEYARLEEWVNKKYYAAMEYIPRNLEKRKDVRTILPEAKSVISLGMNYYNEEKYEDKVGYGKISRYAWGKDYHIIIWEKLESFIEDLQAIDPEIKVIEYVDTGPVMDKAWAVRSGLGWMGKNSNIISKELGSWFFIATLITNYEFDYSVRVQDLCGKCRACIDACPTEAIVNDHVIDANRCISFLTIENKGEIAQEFKGKFENWLFGCDACQDVCPWNIKFALTAREEELAREIVKELSFTEIEKLDETEFKKRFENSPIYRAKLSGLKRNANFIKDTAFSIDN
jgi:epoxyqueuosine reductase